MQLHPWSDSDSDQHPSLQSLTPRYSPLSLSSSNHSNIGDVDVKIELDQPISRSDTPSPSPSFRTPSHLTDPILLAPSTLSRPLNEHLYLDPSNDCDSDISCDLDSLLSDVVHSSRPEQDSRRITRNQARRTHQQRASEPNDAGAGRSALSLAQLDERIDVKVVKEGVCEGQAGGFAPAGGLPKGHVLQVCLNSSSIEIIYEYM